MTIDQMLTEAAESLHTYRDSLALPELDERVAKRRRLSPPLRRLAIVFGAAVILVLVIGVVALLIPLGDDPAPLVDDVTPTTVPATTASSPPPSTAPPTETTEAAVPSEPVPAITWIRTQLLATSDVAALDAIAATEHGLLAGGLDGRDAAIWRSEDGSIWERTTLLTSTGDVEKMADDRFAEAVGFASKGARTVAVGFEGNGDPGPVYYEQFTRFESSGTWLDVNPIAAVWVSDDDSTWTRVPHDESVFGDEDVVRMWAVAASDDRFVAVGDAVWWSEDGLTWERNPSPGHTLFAVIFDGTQFVAAGLNASGGQAAYRSVDGVEWMQMPVERVAEDWSPTPILDLVQVGEAYVASGGGAEAYVWRATDVSVEMSLVFHVNRNRFHYLSGIAVDGNRLVAVGEYFTMAGNLGLVCTSTDGGETWKIETHQEALGTKYMEDEWGAMRDVAIVDGRIIAVGQMGFGLPGGGPAVWTGEWTTSES
jgi:hypothetical protein